MELPSALWLARSLPRLAKRTSIPRHSFRWSSVFKRRSSSIETSNVLPVGFATNYCPTSTPTFSRGVCTTAHRSSILKNQGASPVESAPSSPAEKVDDATTLANVASVARPFDTNYEDSSVGEITICVALLSDRRA